MIFIKENIFFESWDFFKKFSDKSYSFTDCTSFIILKKLGIKNVLAFDKHFRQAGFNVLPKV